MDSLPIGDYALLSDCRSAALVSREGSVDWLVLPRFDGPSVFCRLLDPAGGRFAYRLVGRVPGHPPVHWTRTMVLETTFTTAGGTAVLTDALALGPDERGHELGTGLARHPAAPAGLHRLEIEVEVSYTPPARVRAHPPDPPSRSPAGSPPAAGRTGCSCPPRPASAPRVRPRPPASGWPRGRKPCSRSATGTCPGCRWPRGRRRTSSRRLEDTVARWRAWSGLHQSYDGPWREQVRHSGRVLQALTLRPDRRDHRRADHLAARDGGGERNWDYRFTWVRDASLTMEALWVAACPDRGQRVLRLPGRCAPPHSLGRGSALQIMFGIGGERDLSERALPHLAGWRGSRRSGSAMAPGPSGSSTSTASCSSAASTADRRSASLTRRPGVPDRRRRHRRQSPAGARSGALGDPWRTSALRVLEAHVLGGIGSGDRHGRAPSTPNTGSPAW